MRRNLTKKAGGPAGAAHHAAIPFIRTAFGSAAFPTRILRGARLRIRCARSRTRLERHRRILPASSGFTLLELMVALLILGIGVMGMAQVFVAADRHTAFARSETSAATLAQEIREKILSESFDDLTSMFDDTDTDSPATVSLPAEPWAQHIHDELGETGRGTIDVETPADDETIPEGMVRISIDISWQEGSHTKSVPHHFNIAKVGP